MAPECILNPDSVDARADIYALGAVAYYLLAGTDVFDGKSVVEMCSQHLYQQPPTFSEKGVSISPEPWCNPVWRRILISGRRRPSSCGAASKRARLSRGIAPLPSTGGASARRSPTMPC